MRRPELLCFEFTLLKKGKFQDCACHPSNQNLCFSTSLQYYLQLDLPPLIF